MSVDPFTGIETIWDGGYRITIERVGGIQPISWTVWFGQSYCTGSRSWTVEEAKVEANRFVENDRNVVKEHGWIG